MALNKAKKLLPGAYRGTRKRKQPPEIIWIHCPGCSWRGHPAKIEKAEKEYVKHLERVHYGFLDCAFCDGVGLGYRLLPNFETLVRHVQFFHPEIVAQHEVRYGHSVRTLIQK